MCVFWFVGVMSVGLCCVVFVVLFVPVVFVVFVVPLLVLVMVVVLVVMVLALVVLMLLVAVAVVLVLESVCLVVVFVCRCLFWQQPSFLLLHSIHLFLGCMLDTYCYWLHECPHSWHIGILG